MTTLADLIGAHPSRPSDVAGYWEAVKEWCLGENDTFGTCAFAAIGNLHAVVTADSGEPEVMSDGEIELMDHDVTGFMPTDRSSDHGAALEAVLRYWDDHGWAGDPTLRPTGWCPIAPDQLHQVVHSLGGVYAWAMLPLVDGQWDFSDLALNRGVDGSGAHAFFICGSSPETLWIVTWGELRQISVTWARRYLKGMFAVRHPMWRLR